MLDPVKFVHFGHAAKPLFGALHQPRRLQAPPAAVLLCNPFGEEAARSHRIYRVLATQLMRRGYPALRFDYAGTGDSMGEATEATVDLWLDDVVTAARELTRVSGAKKLVAVGLALGGTLAALATTRRELALEHVLLWDPVVDGAAYLRELGAGHRAYMQSEMGTAYVDRLPTASNGTPREALGMPITPALAEGLAAIALADDGIVAKHVTVVTTTELTAAQRALRERLASSTWIETSTKVPWNSDAALNDAVVPMDILQALMKRIDEVSA